MRTSTTAQFDRCADRTLRRTKAAHLERYVAITLRSQIAAQFDTRLDRRAAKLLRRPTLAQHVSCAASRLLNSTAAQLGL
jgi:hypothetical protein